MSGQPILWRAELDRVAALDAIENTTARVKTGGSRRQRRSCMSENAVFGGYLPGPAAFQPKDLHVLAGWRGVVAPAGCKSSLVQARLLNLGRD